MHSWFGAFAQAPDSFATSRNAFFTSSGGLTDMAYWLVVSFSFDLSDLYLHRYFYTTNKDVARRDTLQADVRRSRRRALPQAPSSDSQ